MAASAVGHEADPTTGFKEAGGNPAHYDGVDGSGDSLRPASGARLEDDGGFSGGEDGGKRNRSDSTSTSASVRRRRRYRERGRSTLTDIFCCCCACCGYQPPRATRRRAAPCYVMLLLFLDVMAVTLILALLPNLAVGFYNNGDECKDDADTKDCRDAAAKVALAQGFSTGASAFLTFVGSPIIGKIADSYGRRTLLMCSQVFSAMPLICLVLYQEVDLSLYAYFGLSVLNGFVNTTALSLAYIADIVSPENRTRKFAEAIAIVSVAAVTGPLIGAFVGQKWAYRIAAFIAMTALPLSWYMPESLPPSRRVPFDTNDLSPLGIFRILNRSTLFRRLGWVVFINAMVGYGILNVLYLYLKNRFSVTEKQGGVLIALWGVCAFCTQAFGIPWATKRGIPNRHILLFGLGAACIFTPLYGALAGMWMGYIVVPLGALSSVSFPAISAIKSNNARAEEQGTVQGALYGVRSLGEGVGPLLLGGVFSLFTSSSTGAPYIPGAPFYVAGVGAIAAFWVARSIPKAMILGKSDGLLGGDDSTAGSDADAFLGVSYQHQPSDDDDYDDNDRYDREYGADYSTEDDDEGGFGDGKRRRPRASSAVDVEADQKRAREEQAERIGASLGATPVPEALEFDYAAKKG